jgi:hypothetical protein
MKRFKELHDLEHAEAAFRNVFAQASYTTPFRNEIGARLLIYPIDYTMLDSSQFAAVARAAARAGDNSAHLAGFGGEESGWGGTYGHRVVDLGSYSDYKAFASAAIVEHFLFSPEGRWGLVTSDGEYALVGGAESFIDNLRGLLQYNELDTTSLFVSDWREIAKTGADAAWVHDVLEHVFGHARAQELWPKG